MWTPADRTWVGDFGSGQALSDDQYHLIEPLIPPAKPGGRPRTTDMRRLLDGAVPGPGLAIAADALPALNQDNNSAQGGRDHKNPGLRREDLHEGRDRAHADHE